MEETITTLKLKVRKALDDIAPQTADSFVGDVDGEIAQALEHAAMSLSRELPLDHLEPTVITATTTVPAWERGQREADGSGYIKLPGDFLRFAHLQIDGWKGTVRELMTPGSDGEHQQRSKWSRGSKEKPRAMLDAGDDGSLLLRYWPGDEDMELDTLAYVAAASIENGTLKCALKAESEKNLIFLACRIFLEGKKEHAAADKFAQLATI